MLFGHGGDVYSLGRELGIDPADVLDFSSNCSPLPYPEGFKSYLSENIHQLHLLPEVDSYSVRCRLSDRYGLAPDSFLLGSGTTQWIFALPRMLGIKNAVIPLPTYSDYRDACMASGLKVQYLGPYPDGSPQSQKRLSEDLLNLDKSQQGKRLIFICNPNNPTGLFLPPDFFLEIIGRLSSAVWVIDEAYAPFVSEDEKSSIITRDLPSNVLVLRSFSKIYGIPGLRIGCLVSTGSIMEHLRSNERPWAVNRMAQLAAEFLLDSRQYEDLVRTTCRREKDFIVSRLSEMPGLEYKDGVTHFALFKVNEPLSAQTIVSCLKRKGMLVRDCANFSGLQGQHIRISPRLHDDNARLIKALGSAIRKAL